MSLAKCCSLRVGVSEWGVEVAAQHCEVGIARGAAGLERVPSCFAGVGEGQVHPAGAEGAGTGATHAEHGFELAAADEGPGAQRAPVVRVADASSANLTATVARNGRAGRGAAADEARRPNFACSGVEVGFLESVRSLI